MGIVTVPRFFLPPPWLEDVDAVQDDVNLTAADHRFAHVFTVTKSGILDKFEFATGTIASINAASVIRVSFRVVVSTTGEPSGVTDQFRDILGSAISASSWISPGLMTDDGTDTGAKRVVTRGDLIAVVIEYQSFTAADNLSIAVQRGRTTPQHSGSCDAFPYDLFQSGGSWNKDSTFGPMLFAMKYADGTYGRPIAPGQLAGTAVTEDPTFSNASTPDERGNIFTLPFPVRVTGAVVRVGANPSGDFEVVLYDTDGSTELETVAVDAEHDVTGDVSGHAPRFVPFAAQHELAIGTYRLTIRPTTATVLRVPSVTLDATAILESVYNLSWFGTSRANLGAWTEENTRFYLLGLVVDGLEEGAGAAGGGGATALSDRGFIRGMIS